MKIANKPTQTTAPQTPKERVTAGHSVDPLKLAELVKLMELAKDRCPDLHPDNGIDFELEQVQAFISSVLLWLRKDNKPTQTTEPQTPKETATTMHRYGVDPLGYDIRILCDSAGCDVRVDPNRKPPAGYRQVCRCCGNDDFSVGMTACPQCHASVIYRCRYVAIAGFSSKPKCKICGNDGLNCNYCGEQS